MVFSLDSGLVVPTITYEVRSRLFEIADSKGFTATRRLDLIGRSTSEMVLQLIGGSHRLISFLNFRFDTVPLIIKGWELLIKNG